MLLQRGDCVAATLRDPSRLDDLADRFGDQLWRVELDVTDTALRAVVATAFAELGRIDVVASNAGYGLIGLAEEVTDEQITRQLDTNLLASAPVASRSDRAGPTACSSPGGVRLSNRPDLRGRCCFGSRCGTAGLIRRPRSARRWAVRRADAAVCPTWRDHSFSSHSEVSNDTDGRSWGTALVAMQHRSCLPSEGVGNHLPDGRVSRVADGAD